MGCLGGGGGLMGHLSLMVLCTQTYRTDVPPMVSTELNNRDPAAEH